MERKVKKVKKEKRSKKPSTGTEVKIKVEKRSYAEDEDRSHSKSKRRKKENDHIVENKEDLDIKEYEKNLLDNATADRGGAAKRTGKIIIKSLKNSTIYKDAIREVEASSMRSDEKHADYFSAGSRESSISLSDEETYRKEKEKYYSNYYDSRSASRSTLNNRDFNYDRDRNRHDRRYERSISREHRRYYDDRDRRRYV